MAGGLLTGKYQPGQQPPPDTRAGGDEMTRRGMSMRMSEQSFAIVDAVRAVGEQLGKTPAQVALKWVMSREGVTAPILGARTPEQLEHNLGVLSMPSSTPSSPRQARLASDTPTSSRPGWPRSASEPGRMM